MMRYRWLAILLSVFLCSSAGADPFTWDSGYKGDLPDGSDIILDTSNFDLNLSAADIDAQTAFETLDELIAGSSMTLDLADDASNESTALGEIATTGDTNSIFSEPSDDKLLITLSNNWPSADTADALSANGANCAAGEIALGVDASGAVEGCYEPTEADITDLVHTVDTGPSPDCSGTLTYQDGEANCDTVGTTAGSVLFINAGATSPTEDATNFFWDDTAKELGVGTTTPGAPLDVVKNQDTATYVRIGNNNGGTLASAGFFINNGTDNLIIQHYGVNVPTSAYVQASTSVIRNNLGTGLNLVADTAGGGVGIWTGGNTTAARMNIDTDGVTVFNEQGADADFRIEASGVSDALQVNGADGEITLGALGDGVVHSDASGVLSSSKIVAGDLDLSFIQGSVIFADASGELAEDNANLFWDDTNNRQGIGTTTPATALDVTGTVSVDGIRTLDRVSGATNSLIVGNSGANLASGGTDNVLVGANAGDDTVATDLNTYIGSGAGEEITGSSNVAVGYDALKGLDSSSTVSSTVAIGDQALTSLLTGGNNNLAIGYWAGKSLTTGDNNVAIGYKALSTETTTSAQVAIGTDALKDNSGGYSNVAVGNTALQKNTTGHSNFALGASAMQFNLDGHSNVGIGVQALYDNTSGHSNVALGGTTLADNTTGDLSIAIGKSALRKSTTSSSNVSIGASSGSELTGATSGNNTIIGHQAMISTPEGDSNVAIGYRAGAGAAGSTFDDVVLVGYEAGDSITTGNANIAVGWKAGDNITTGANNLLLGYNIDAQSATASNQMSLGNLIFSEGIDGETTTISSGNVGIGVVAPAQKLDIAGDILIQGDDIFATTNTTGALWVGDGTNYNPVVMSADASIDAAGAVTVADDSHNHTTTTLSSIDISDDTNLAATAPIVLTDDTLSYSHQWAQDLDANAFDLQFNDATGIRDDSDNEQLIFQKTASAVNHFEMTNAATAGSPALAVAGDDTDIDMTFQVKGTGTYKLFGTATTAAMLHWYEDTDNGANWTAFKGAPSIASNITWILPATDSTGSQSLTSDGAGNLSWTSHTADTGPSPDCTGTDQYQDGDGGCDTVGGDVSGQLSATVVANDSHDHTTTTISGVDISDDTNLAVSSPVTLTGDTVGWDSTLTDALTWGDGTSHVWTHDVGAVNPTVTYATGAVTHNVGASDVDYTWATTAHANSLFVQGSDGHIGMWDATPTAWLAMTPPDETSLSGTQYLMDAELVLNPASASSGDYWAADIATFTKSGNAQNFTGQLEGVNGSVSHQGTGIVTNAWGNIGIIYNTSSGTVTNAHAVDGFISNTSTGTITNAFTVYADLPVNSGGGTITNSYAFYNEDFGTSDFAHYSEGGDFYIGGNDRLGIGDTTPDATLEVIDTVSDTNSINEIAYFGRASTGTVAAGFGERLRFQLDDDGGSVRDVVDFSAVWADPASATLHPYAAIGTRDGGAGMTNWFFLDELGQIGLGASMSDPTYDFTFDGEGDATIGMEREATASADGRDLTILAGGGDAGSTDVAGGDLVLQSGIATGDGESKITFATVKASQGTGTTDRSPVVYFQMDEAHFEALGTTPAISSCGGVGSSVTGEDTAMRITVGVSSSSSCVITFDETWTNAPVCTANTNGTFWLIGTSTSTTQLTVSSSPAMTGGTQINVLCLGFE